VSDSALSVDVVVPRSGLTRIARQDGQVPPVDRVFSKGLADGLVYGLVDGEEDEPR